MDDQVQVLAVDVFGTTVDWWTGVARQVDQIAVERGARLDGGELASAWRARYLPSVAAVRKGRRPWAHLDTLHRESLDDLLNEFGVAAEFDEDARHRMVLAWRRLPPWPDVEEGLRRLRTRYSVVALSNGGFAMLTHLLKNMKLSFDAIISAEMARTYKPGPTPYRLAAELLDVAPERVLMVACHSWDLDGARIAGLRTAFVERPSEKGPRKAGDRATDTTCDVACASFTDLAQSLDC